MNSDFDVIIVGAGPAGLTTAIKLADSSLSIALIDQNTIPYNKVCGDALSGSVMTVLKRLPGNCYRDFLKLPGLLPSQGIRFYAPSGKYLDVPFRLNPDPSMPAPGYTCRRVDFDGFLAGRTTGYPNISLFPEKKVTGLKPNGNGILVQCSEETFNGKMVVGADGVNSLAGRVLAGNKEDHKKYCLGIRGYYRNVSDLHPENFIELHFIRELLPGYLWIFPMSGGMANVGLGMLYDQVKKEKGSLLEKLNFLVKNDPSLAERFKTAELTGNPEAHGLPLGPDKKPLSGDHFLLAGDAASLVDPFTGEGIGNAMLSGEIAAGVIEKAFGTGDFSGPALRDYDRKISEKFFGELRTSSMIRKFAASSILFDRVVGKASKNEELRKMLISMYVDDKSRQVLTNPLFYARLLIK